MAPLYKPPTAVVTSQMPLLALVEQNDPDWARYKYWEPEYITTQRLLMANPYQRGAYNHYSNIYPVGAQYGSTDPAQVALAAFNLGAAANVNVASISLTLAQAVPAGSLIVLSVVDSSSAFAASALSDSGGNEYETLYSVASVPFAVAYAVTTAALGIGATLTYASPSGVVSSMCMVAVAITGGFKNDIFDRRVFTLAAGYLGASNPPFSATTPSPAGSDELFVAFARAGTVLTFTPDTADGWLNMQQCSAGGSAPKSLCSSFQTGGTLDPGVYAPLTFAPLPGGTASNWQIAILGIKPVVPMITSDATGGWA